MDGPSRSTHRRPVADLRDPYRQYPPEAWHAARLNRIFATFRLNGGVLKKVIALLVVGFAIYYLLTAPEGAALSVRNAFNAVLDGFSQVMVFVNKLFAS